jgi:hypothetical protein
MIFRSLFDYLLVGSVVLDGDLNVHSRLDGDLSLNIRNICKISILKEMQQNQLAGTYDLLNNVVGAEEIDHTLVDTHLKAIPSLGT